MMRAPAVAVLALVLLSALPSRAQEPGLVTHPSPHDVRGTIDRFTAAVRQAGWVVFTEIDHADAARTVGLQLKPRTVVLFGNPTAGTPAMAASPTLALDLPLRVLVWQDETGRTQITRSTAHDLAERVFARHGITVPPPGRVANEAFLTELVAKATQ